MTQPILTNEQLLGLLSRTQTEGATEELASHRKGHWFESSIAQLLTGLLHEFRDEIALSVIGSGGGRILQLRSKTNSELLALYDPEIVLRLHNARNLKDTMT